MTYNQVVLLGKVGKDAEHKTFGENTVSEFSLATDNNKKDKDGNWVNNTDWHSVSAWKLTDYVKTNLVKGATVMVQGRIEYQVSEKDGTKKYFTKIIADKVIPVLDKKKVIEDAKVVNEDTDQSLPF